MIAIDHHLRRLAPAKQNGAEVLNYHEVKVLEALKEMTAGIGPRLHRRARFCARQHHRCGQAGDETGRRSPACPARGDHGLPQGQTHLHARVYGGIGDTLPIDAFMQRGLTLKTGQTHVQKYLPKLLELVMDGRIDTTDLISRRLPLEGAATAYRNFHGSPKEWTKVVLNPHCSQTSSR